MKTVWTKGCADEEEKAERLSLFKQSANLRKLLTTIVETKVREIEKTSFAVGGYDCPNWAYKQADTQGYKRAMSEILSLIH